MFASAVSLVIASFFTAEAVLSSPPHAQAARVVQAPVLDGRVEDQAWTVAPVGDGFTQKWPKDGASPSERTSFRILYDDKNVYIAVACDQRKAPVLARLTRRDREIESDRVEITIDSRGDATSAFHFSVNAAGVLRDGLYFDENDLNTDWDENWEAWTASTAGGWSTEIRIPLRVLRFEARPVQDWGFNVQRHIAYNQEKLEWAYVPRTEAGYMSRLGRLDDLRDLRPGAHEIELRPFIVGRFARQDAEMGPAAVGMAGLASVHRRWRTAGDAAFMAAGASVGIDARLHLSRDVTFDATVNPDFGQVEADEVVLNLTKFETFYPEKRPFFLEGMDLFETPMRVLYTRRIGRVPRLPRLAQGEEPALALGPDTIPVALKLVGRPGGLFNLGLLSALTSANAVPVLRADGTTIERLAAPLTAYNVLRIKRAAGNGGHLGLFATATNRPMAASGERLCPGEETPSAASSCFADAYVAAADTHVRLRRDYTIDAQALVSVLDGGLPRSLPDGTVIRPGELGTAMVFSVDKDGGKHWVWDWDNEFTSRGFDNNDLGFSERQNQIVSGIDLAYRTTDPWWHTLETESAFEYEQARNLDGLRLKDEYQLNTEWKLRSFWSMKVAALYRRAAFDDREVGDGTALERARAWVCELGLVGDPRNALAGSYEQVISWRPNGVAVEARATLTFRLLPQVDLDLTPEVGYTQGEPRFIERMGDREFLFGRLTAREVGATMRATYTFTPRISLQAYAQLFLASGEYNEPSAYIGAPNARPTISLRDLIPAASMPSERQDFQEAALNANILLRWEYRLGSVLYLVYNRAQLPDIELDPGARPRLDLRVLPRAPAVDVFMMKMSYWWG